MRKSARVVPLAALAALIGGCGSKQSDTEKILLRWSPALNHHLATDMAGGNEYPARLADIDPKLRVDASLVDAWERPLHYRKVNDSLYDLVSKGEDGTLGNDDDVVMSNSILYKPEKIYAARPAARGLLPQVESADEAAGGDGQ
jgi:hypothetical protein